MSIPSIKGLSPEILLFKRKGTVSRDFSLRDSSHEFSLRDGILPTDGSGQRESLPLKPQHEVLPDHHRPPSGGVDRPVAGEADHLPCKLRRRDASPVWGGDVAVIPRHGVRDADPGGGGHVAVQGDVAGPRLVGDVPPNEVWHRDDVLETDGGLQRRRAVEAEAEVVEGSARVSQMRQQLHGDVPLDVGQGGVELVQLEDHPSRGEVHVVGERSFHRDRYRKSERRTRQSGFTDFAGFEFAD